MPKDIPNVLQRFAITHKPRSTPLPLPASSTKKPYNNAIQHDTTQLLNQQETTRIQQIIGCLLYYARALNNTILVALNTISEIQAVSTATTKTLCNYLLNYCATNRNVGLRYYASNMTSTIHSDAAVIGRCKS